MMKNESKVGDLTSLATSLEATLRNYFGTEERPTLAIAFSLPPDYEDVHWVTNVSRDNGIQLFEQTAKKMIAQTN